MLSVSDSLSSYVYRVSSPFRAIAKRWGPQYLKKTVWEKEYRRGEWLIGHVLHKPLICDFIQQYCRKGSVLDLGCADGIIGLTLDEGSYSRYTGVDISTVAIEEANAKCAALTPSRQGKNSYAAGDIAAYVPDHQLDVILFRQSLYYLPGRQIKAALDRYKTHLNPDGVFVVVMCDIKRHAWITDIIRENFAVLLDEATDDTIVLIFR